MMRKIYFLLLIVFLVACNSDKIMLFDVDAENSAALRFVNADMGTDLSGNALLGENDTTQTVTFVVRKDATDKRSEADKLRMGIIEQLYKTDSIRKLRLVSTFAAKEVCLKCKAAFAPGENCECEREPVSSEADALRAEIARFMETVGTSELRFVYGFLRA